jgi:hypothetical protein
MVRELLRTYAWTPSKVSMPARVTGPSMMLASGSVAVTFRVHSTVLARYHCAMVSDGRVTTQTCLLTSSHSTVRVRGS